MCIATSWTSHRVAVLVVVCDLIVLVLSASIAQSTESSATSMNVAASSLAILSAATLASSNLRRGTFASLLVGTFMMHGIWQSNIMQHTKKIDAQLDLICQQPPVPQDLSTISSLLAMAPATSEHGVGSPERIAAEASTLFTELVAQQQEMRARTEPRAGSSPKAVADKAKKRELRLCKLSYVQLVFGSLLQLITATVTLGGVAMLLEFVCFSKCWCEETPSGRRFRRWMFDEVEDEVSRPSEADRSRKDA